MGTETYELNSRRELQGKVELGKKCRLSVMHFAFCKGPLFSAGPRYVK